MWLVLDTGIEEFRLQEQIIGVLTAIMTAARPIDRQRDSGISLLTAIVTAARSIDLHRDSGISLMIAIVRVA